MLLLISTGVSAMSEINCNIKDTELVMQLLTVPVEKRNENWESSFSKKIKTAAFTTNSSQLRCLSN